MYRTRTCGELRLCDEGQNVTLAGWVQRTRKMGGMTFIDLRDRYGITQLVFNEEVNAMLCEQANKIGREYVIQVTGTVKERSSKNANIPTGEIELIVSELNILNAAMTPPFTIEDETDGGDDLRMKYRYLDLRRNIVRKNLELRHRMAQWNDGEWLHAGLKAKKGGTFRIKIREDMPLLEVKINGKPISCPVIDGMIMMELRPSDELAVNMRKNS